MGTFRPRVPFITIINRLGLSAGLKLCLDAGDIASVTSSSPDKWLDQSGGGYDFFLGTGTGVDAKDPIWNGTPGNLSANEYFSSNADNPNGKNFIYDSTQEAWMDNLHKNNAKFTILSWVYPQTGGGGAGGTTNTVICGDNAGGAGTGVGMHLLITSAAILTFRQANQPSAGNMQAIYSTTCPLGQWDFVGISLDEAVGANGGFLYQNGVAELFNSTYSNPATGTASFKFQVGDRGNNQSGGLPQSSRLAFVAIWEGVALTQAQVAAIYNATASMFQRRPTPRFFRRSF